VTAERGASAARLALLTTSVASCWLLFMAVHEFGHVLAAWATGGHVARVVLSPLSLSRTDVTPNPHPMVEVWGGPAFGAAVPLLLWALWRAVRRPGALWLQGFAGFCLIANGLYIASGAAFAAGDTEELLRLGTPRVVLALLGAPAAGTGLYLLHRLGPALGTGQLDSRRARSAARWSGAALCALVIVMLVLSGGPGPMR
jgi:hypothetical protein